MPRPTSRPLRLPAALAPLLAVVLGLLLTACGPPPVEVDANDPQTAMRLADQWVAALPAYAETTRAADAFLPALTDAEGDAEAVAVVRRAGSVGDGVQRMQEGLEAWVEQSLRATSGAAGLTGVRTVGLAAGRAQGHLQRAADALGKDVTVLDDTRLRALAAKAGVTSTAGVDALVAAYTWAVAPYATPDAPAHTTAQLRQALRSGPPATG